MAKHGSHFISGVSSSKGASEEEGERKENKNKSEKLKKTPVTGKICTEPFSYLPVSYPQCTAAPANFAAYVHVHSLNSMYVYKYIYMWQR